jgi:hypothetical protein
MIRSSVRWQLAIVAVCGVLPLLAAPAAAGTGAKKPVLRIPPGVYSGTVTMSPVYQGPPSSVSITLRGKWTLKVDRHDNVTGNESLTGTMPISVSSGCSATPGSYTLGFAATFGRTQVGFGITGAPGFVQGNALVIALDSETGTGATTDQGWSATPGSYQLACGSLAPGTDGILFFGELGVPISHYTVRLPLALFSRLGHAFATKVERTSRTPRSPRTSRSRTRRTETAEPHPLSASHRSPAPAVASIPATTSREYRGGRTA